MMRYRILRVGSMAALLALAVACSGAGSGAQSGEEAERGLKAARGESADRTQPGEDGGDVSREMVSVAAGTELQVRLERELSTDANQAGDTFTATVTSPVRRGDAEVVPAGAVVRGQVTAVQEADGETEANVLKLDFTEIEVRGQSYPLEATLVDAQVEQKSKTSTGEAAAKIGGGAAAGAILGRIIGGDGKGALIGAAVGAAAGTAIVLGTRDTKAVLPNGSAMRLRLDQPLRVQLRE